MLFVKLEDYLFPLGLFALILFLTLLGFFLSFWLNKIKQKNKKESFFLGEKKNKTVSLSEYYNKKIVSNVLCEVIFSLWERKIGALVTVQRHENLEKFYNENGIIIDAKLSKELLIVLFNPHSILHDGAVIIEKDRIRACSVYFPLEPKKLKKTDINFGSRYRAAVFITQISDCFSIIVSGNDKKIIYFIDGKAVEVNNFNYLTNLIFDALV